MRFFVGERIVRNSNRGHTGEVVDPAYSYRKPWGAAEKVAMIRVKWDHADGQSWVEPHTVSALASYLRGRDGQPQTTTYYSSEEAWLDEQSGSMVGRY
jgi:hypothetical protein